MYYGVLQIINNQWFMKSSSRFSLPVNYLQKATKDRSCNSGFRLLIQKSIIYLVKHCVRVWVIVTASNACTARASAAAAAEQGGAGAPGLRHLPHHPGLHGRPARQTVQGRPRAHWPHLHRAAQTGEYRHSVALCLQISSPFQYYRIPSILIIRESLARSRETFHFL